MKYKYCVYYNNCGVGVQFVKAFERLIEALNYKEYLQNSGCGCCDVVKKRFKTGGEKPVYNYIGNNYKYNWYDLEV